uniref:Putative single-stranded DNA binding protein n=1 Tax=Ahnfeltia plicata TaxID=28023 RepID=A0A1C9CAY4_9FLOR|nr:putative single-stranded DNA binding protein [Ahnfeltia plicata]AOM65537.1 putative single-stranded DNA binding protein [Ahnfeltia plicata]UAT97257.1 putative single-stranded DNA binding protein [Ahnfeltia plicata]UAT97462.1 putative single-stranded DNA binding protein [Ahnfeltia plicata]
MNICFLTGKIVQSPKQLLYQGNYSTKLSIILPNNKRGLFLQYVTGLAKGKVGQDIFELYSLGDYIILEGSLSLQENKDLNSGFNKSILVNIYRLHPAHLIYK